MASSLTSNQPLPEAYDATRTLAALTIGSTDPCWRVAPGHRRWLWATRSPLGPATLQMTIADGTVESEAWGAGAGWALAAVPHLLGLEDDPDAFAPDDVLVGTVARFPGFRLGATGRIATAAIAGVCRRGVSSFEAGRSWSLMVEAFGDAAPGPGDLRLPPAPRRLAAADPYDLHVMGLEQSRADEVRRIASHSNRLERDGDEPVRAAIDRLANIAGIGDDVVEHARAMALGDPDAVPVIDPHHLAVVVRSLRTSDDQAVDAPSLLERYRPQRGRVVRLLALSADDGILDAGVTP